jgi:dihydroorotate dehydrogenase
MYKRLIRPLLFSMDPEQAHQLVMRMGHFLFKCGFSGLIKQIYGLEDKRLEQECFGLKFKNPVGLAAGSDKNCEAQEFLSAFGFGFLESVSFVFEQQDGNPKPRVFRLPKDNALINRMGFPSIGAEKLSSKLREAKKNLSKSGTILAVNFGKSKSVPLDNAVDDYLKSFRIMREIVDYIVINVSSPNTPGLRDLQEKSRLDEILKAVQAENKNGIPLLVKVAPDLSLTELDDILDCASSNNLQGIVATNSSKSREGLISNINEEGGLSGKPLFPKSLEFVRYIRKRFNGELKIIGVGGISRAEDAIEMFRAGADLIEMYAALIYEGPGVAYNIKRGILKYMRQNGMSEMKDLIGSEKN